MDNPDLASQHCLTCHQPVDGHTIAGYRGCLTAAGVDYHLPFEETPGGPLTLPGLDGPLVGALDIQAGFVGTPLGRKPVLRFQFTGPGPTPGEIRALPPVNLLMDASSMRDLRPMIAQAIDQAILGARRGH